MKLLVIGPDMRDRSRVKNFTGVQAFYICRELRKLGVELQFVESKFNSADPSKPHDPVAYFKSLNDDSGCDHVLALGLRYFTTVPQECAGILKTKVRGRVTQMHDGVPHEQMWPMPGVDCTFTFRDESKRDIWTPEVAKRNHYIGWAADPELIWPQQKPGELRLLIDHPYYKSGTPDWTDSITQQAIVFARGDMWKYKYQSIRLRMLVNGGAADVNWGEPTTQPFDRKHIPFEQIAAEYNATSVYLVTHKESVGLTCLETAMAGALVVAPRDFIPADRIRTLHNITYIGASIPWNAILNSIDIAHARAIASVQTWDKVAKRMMDYFEANR